MNILPTISATSQNGFKFVSVSANPLPKAKWKPKAVGLLKQRISEHEQGVESSNKRCYRHELLQPTSADFSRQREKLSLFQVH